MIVVKGEGLGSLAAETVGRSLAKDFWVLGSALTAVQLNVADITSGTTGLGSGNVDHGLFKANAVSFVARNDATIVSAAETFVVLLEDDHNVFGVNCLVAESAGAVHVSGHGERLVLLFCNKERERERERLVSINRAVDR